MIRPAVFRQLSDAQNWSRCLSGRFGGLLLGVVHFEEEEAALGGEGV